MSWIEKREIPLLIFAITFILACFGYYLDVPAISTIYSEMFDWVLILSNLALGTGLIAFILHHSKRVSKRERGYQMSLVAFSALLLMLVACFASPGSREYLYSEIYTPVSIAVLCFTGFSEITGMYRSFKVRNIDALFLAVSGFIVLMYFAPLYGFLVPDIAKVANWILDNPAMGASRGIIIGIAIGTIALSIRIILGYEKAYTG